MAIDIITGFNSASRESLDKRSGPYASLADAKAALDTNERFIGLKVLVISNSTTDGAGNYIGGNLTEYIFEGGITDNDLVEVVTIKNDVDTAIQTAVNDLVDGAPTTLDTLNEIAAAINNNADFLDAYYTQTEVDTALSDKVDNGGGVATIRKLTQAEYDAITPDPNTLYIITV